MNADEGEITVVPMIMSAIICRAILTVAAALSIQLRLFLVRRMVGMN